MWTGNCVSELQWLFESCPQQSGVDVYSVSFEIWSVFKSTLRNNFQSFISLKLGNCCFVEIVFLSVVKFTHFHV